MKILVRTKSFYNPLSNKSALPGVEVIDFAGTTIGKIKENIKQTNPAAKVDELFLRQADGSYLALSDDRSVARYNLQDGDILETVSNPLWAVSMQILHFEAETKLQNCEVDNKRHRNTWEQSLIRKRTIMSVLYNSKKDKGDRQPPFLEKETDLDTFLKTLSRKGAEMSPITISILKNYRIQYQELDSLKADPIGSFISRYRRILNEEYGVLNTAAMYDPDNDPHPEAGIRGGRKGKGRGGGKSAGHVLGGVRLGGTKGSGVGLGRRVGGAVGHGAGNVLGGATLDGGVRGGAEQPGPSGTQLSRQKADGTPGSTVKKAAPRKKKERLCEDCSEGEENVATLYCPECQGGLALCVTCCDNLHRGAARRNHRILDIHSAPKQQKAYAPEPYRAPFAMLVGLYSGYHEEPRKLSMTEDVLKERAQKVTDTDLSDKQSGKYVSGFDSMDRTLITKGLVQKEDADNPSYALTESGVALGKKLLMLHNAIAEFLSNCDLPTLPPLALQPPLGTQCGNRNVLLLIDVHEKEKDRLIELCREASISTQVRELPCGDYMWILPPAWAGKDYTRCIPDLEQVLPHVVERKTWDDFGHSVRGSRFINQVNRMKSCGFRDLFYLVEGEIDGMRTKPTYQYKVYLQEKLLELQLDDGFLVNRTSGWRKTAEWLKWLTFLIADTHRNGSGQRLMTYEEYNAKATAKDIVPVTPGIRARRKVHTWTAQQFTGLLVRDAKEEIAFSTHVEDLLSLPNRVDQPRPLLIIRDLLEYNKARHRLFKRCGDTYITENRSPRECVRQSLQDVTSQLVHYDIPSYWQLYMQVMLGLNVIRTEGNEDTAAVQEMFLHDNNNVAIDGGPEPTVTSSLNDEDYANNSQTFQDMMNKAMLESATSAKPKKHLAPALDGSKNVHRPLSHTLDGSKNVHRPLSHSDNICFAASQRVQEKVKVNFNGKATELANNMTEEEQLKHVLELSRMQSCVSIQDEPGGGLGNVGMLSEEEQLQLAIQQSQRDTLSEQLQLAIQQSQRDTLSDGLLVTTRHWQEGSPVRKYVVSENNALEETEHLPAAIHQSQRDTSPVFLSSKNENLNNLSSSEVRLNPVHDSVTHIIGIDDDEDDDDVITIDSQEVKLDDENIGAKSAADNEDVISLEDSQEFESGSGAVVVRDSETETDNISLMKKEPWSCDDDTPMTCPTMEQDLLTAIEASRKSLERHESTCNYPLSGAEGNVVLDRSISAEVSQDVVDDDLKRALELSMPSSQVERTGPASFNHSSPPKTHKVSMSPRTGKSQKVIKQEMDEALIVSRLEAQAKWKGVSPYQTPNTSMGVARRSRSRDEKIARNLEHLLNSAPCRQPSAAQVKADEEFARRMQEEYTRSTQLCIKNSVNSNSPCATKRKHVSNSLANHFMDEFDVVPPKMNRTERRLDVPATVTSASTRNTDRVNTQTPLAGTNAEVDDYILLDEDEEVDLPLANDIIGTKDNQVETQDTGDAAIAVPPALGNMKCGACRVVGHNRKWKHCTMYYTQAEIERREVQNDKRQQVIEKKANEKQEALNMLRDKQRELEAVRQNVTQQIDDVQHGMQDLVKFVEGRKAGPKEPRGGGRGGRGNRRQ